MCLDYTSAWVWNEIRQTQVSQMRNELHFNVLALLVFSINLLVVYRESVNLIGYITRRLCADSLQL